MQNDLQNLATRLEHLSAALERFGVEPACSCGSGGTHVAGHPAATPRPVRAGEVALVEAVMRSRKRRAAFLDGDLLFDPAWAMLLDIYCATLRGKRLSVTAVMLGSGVPDTTALRYLKVLEERGHVARVADETDRRRSFVTMSTSAFEGMKAYFAALEADTMAILPLRRAANEEHAGGAAVAPRSSQSPARRSGAAGR